MSEMTQTLAAEPKQVTAVAVEANAKPSFPELIYAHHAWWQEMCDGNLTRPTQEQYDRLRAAFEQAHGEISRAYWCLNVQSAVVLTERKPGLLRSTPQCSFHRETEWATHHCPEIATELHRCDELAVRATTVLTGVRQRICMNLVMAAAEHLVALADRRAGEAAPAPSKALLDRERAALNRAEAYYKEAANGQAQIVYFAGMTTVVLVVAVFAALWLSISWATGVAALVAGSVGAVVSVIQRINSGKFELDYDVGRPYALFLGGLRPLIGGAFAMAISFAFDGGLLHLPVSETESRADRRLALLVVSFVAGFSERWAQDALVSAVPGAKRPEAPPAAPAKPAAADSPETTRPAG
jgi:hypothetical protein